MIDVVGLGLAEEHLSFQSLEIIRSADVLVGGRAQLAAFESLAKTQIVARSPIAETMGEIEQARSAGLRIVVLADGDPMCFGIGETLVRAFGRGSLRIYSNISAPQAAVAKLGISSVNMRVVSLHGRKDVHPLYAGLTHNDVVGVYTDERNTPAVVAEMLLARGVVGFTMHVCEKLCREDETVRSFSLEEAAAMRFARPNFIVLERPAQAAPALRFGIADDIFLQFGRMFTKGPVRAAALAALDLPKDGLLWDVGAGTGAVSVEAAAIMPRGGVIAVERHPERAAWVRECAKRCGAWSVHVVHGEMPGVAAELADPDRIFIGGGARDEKLLGVCCERLIPGGRLAATCVLLESLHSLQSFLITLGWEYEITQIGFSTGRSLDGGTALKAENPVFLLTAHKPGAEK